MRSSSALSLTLALGLILTWGVAALPVAAQQNEDVFASDGGAQAPAACGRAYAACAADDRLEKSTDERVRKAGASCYGDLDSALELEDQLNDQLDQMDSMSGQPRDEFYSNTVQPTNKARVQALGSYRACFQRAMIDMRPADYPKSGTLLHAGVSNTEPPPGQGEAWKATLRETLHKMNDALDPVATPLQNLSNVLNAIAPHYDMVSRSDTGLRVIKDILVDMGAGHVTGLAAGALRRMAAKAGGAALAAARGVGKAGNAALTAGEGAVEGAATRAGAATKAGGRGSGKFGSGNPVPDSGGAVEIPGIMMGTTGYKLPWGMKMPPMLAKTLRPTYFQEDTHSCVLACVRMVEETIKRVPLPEKALRSIVKGPATFKPGVGTSGPVIADMLTKLGINNRGWRRTGFYAIKKSVGNGYPAIVTFGKQHVAIVDAVAEHAGQEWVFLRNSTNPEFWDATEREFFESVNYGNYVTMLKDDFMRLYNSGGRHAVITQP